VNSLSLLNLSSFGPPFTSNFIVKGMVSHRAAIRAAAVFKRVQQLNPPPSSSSPSSSTPSPSRRTTPSTQPHPSQWLQQRSPAPLIEPKSALLLPKPPFIEIMDPAVFSHPSLAGDLQVYRFQQPIHVKPSPLKRKWDRRTESFEKLEVRSNIVFSSVSLY